MTKAKKVLEITNGKGVDVVYDGVGKKTFEGSLTCIKLRGMFITFGNASGPIKNIDVKKGVGRANDVAELVLCWPEIALSPQFFIRGRLLVV